MAVTTGFVEEKKSFTFTPPPRLLEHWQKFCGLKGLVQKDAAAAAFRLFQFAPPELRDLAMQGNDKSIKAWFDAAIEKKSYGETLAFLKSIQNMLAETPDAPRPKGSAETA